jgi:hypothetical protein
MATPINAQAVAPAAAQARAAGLSDGPPTIRNTAP